MQHTAKVDRQLTPFRGLPQVMQHHPLFFYFLLAYVFSWLVEIPYVVLSQTGIRLAPSQLSFPLNVLTLANPFVGPLLAAFLMTGICTGKTGIIRLLRRCVVWRVGLPWYLCAIFGILLISLLGAIILPGVASSFQASVLTSPTTYLPLIFATGGPLGEEPGWRGFALPRLQQIHGPLKGTLLLGLLWSFWHFLLFFTPNEGWFPGITLGTFFVNFGLFTLGTIALTIFMTWVSNNTQNSLLLVILLHASVNLAGNLLGHLFLSPLTGTGQNIGFCALALLVIILTRGRLSYRPETTQPVTRKTMESTSES